MSSRKVPPPPPRPLSRSAEFTVIDGYHDEGDGFVDARDIERGHRKHGEVPRRGYRLYHGDCIKAMASMPDNSVDAIVSDPPYGLGFMGKQWDKLPPGPAFAEQALRILKPGGHIIAFGGTRTMHRLTVALEDAGFEIRDTIHWCYWSGFPKGMDLSKQFDKKTVRDRETGELVFGGGIEDVYAVTRYIADARDRAGYTNAMIDEHFGYTGMAGHWTSQKSQPQIPAWETWLELKRLLDIEEDDIDNEVWRLNGRKGQPGEAWHEREVVGEYDNVAPANQWRHNLEGDDLAEPAKRTAPLTEHARAWEGWNTALKPAIEPAVLARKPLSEKTVAANILRWGTGAVNVDGCRMSEADDCWPGPKPAGGKLQPNNSTGTSGVGSGTGAEIYGYREGVPYVPNDGGWWPANLFYCSKPYKTEREAGLGEDFEAKVRMPDLDEEKEWVGGHNAYLCGGAVKRKNNHPTVKPIKLMRWLCRMVCPPGGVVLDPFMGSGSTGCAAMLEGFDFIGCELFPLPPGHPEFDPKNMVDAVGISQARIEHWRTVAMDNDWTETYGTIAGLIASAEAK